MNVRISRCFLPDREEFPFMGMPCLVFLPIGKISSVAPGYLVKAGNCSMIKFNSRNPQNSGGFWDLFKKSFIPRARDKGGGVREGDISPIYILNY